MPGVDLDLSARRPSIERVRAARPQDLVGQARLDVAYGASEHHRADEPAEQQHRLVAGLPRSEFSVVLADEFRGEAGQAALHACGVRALDGLVVACGVDHQGSGGAAAVRGVAVLGREVVVHHPPLRRAGGSIPVLDGLRQHVQGRRERGVAHLGGQVVLGREVVVETAVRQARFLTPTGHASLGSCSRPCVVRGHARRETVTQMATSNSIRPPNTRPCRLIV